MIAASPAYYADTADVKLWEEDRNPSAYVEFMKPKHNLVVNGQDYQCKFLIYNTGVAVEESETEAKIFYFRFENLNIETELIEEVDLLREEAMDEVRTFANFQDDWDGYGAIRPLSECLNHALDIIRNEKISLDYLTDIYPNPNGTLTLEWEQDDNEIGLEVGSREFSYYAHFGEVHTYNNQKLYVAKEIEKLAGYISFMC